MKLPWKQLIYSRHLIEVHLNMYHTQSIKKHFQNDHVHFNWFFQAPVADAMAIVWEFFQPLLFGLIGAEVSIEYMDSALIGM